MEHISNSDWRVFPEFPDYAITPDGQVWSFKRNKFLKQYLNNDKYLVVELRNGLKRKNCKVHRLVGMAFVRLPKKFNGNYLAATINHKDHVRTNNHYTNLEWVTQSCNVQEAWDNGYCDDLKKQCFCISIEDKKYTPSDSASEMDRSLDLPIGTVTKAISRANGILQGKYIVGYTENLDKKYLLPEPDAVGIIQLYSGAIANYKPHRKECFYIDSLDNSYHKSVSTRGIDKELNLPASTTSYAIYKHNGLIRGRYIAGYLDDPKWKGVPANPTVEQIEQIVESYAEQIERYKQRGPKKITNLQTNESKIYNSLSDFAEEKGIHPNNVRRYLKAHSDLYKVELV